MAFADRLREWRRRRLLSQKDLATELGVALSTVQRWEMGLNLPFPAHQRRLVEVLKIEPDDLLAALEEPREEGKEAA